MRYLVIYAHPVDDSFVAALHRKVVSALHAAGHAVDDCDLHAEGFMPVLSAAERQTYHDTGANHDAVQKEIGRLLACEGLVFVFPTWWYGMPAILKGYIDRVWLPGVAFTLDGGGRTRPLLHHVLRFAVVTTYGSPWWLNKLIGDPSRSTFMKGIRLLCPKARALWLAQYGMDAITADARMRFLAKVEHRMRQF